MKKVVSRKQQTQFWFVKQTEKNFFFNNVAYLMLPKIIASLLSLLHFCSHCQFTNKIRKKRLLNAANNEVITCMFFLEALLRQLLTLLQLWILLQIGSQLCKYQQGEIGNKDCNLKKLFTFKALKRTILGQNIFKRFKRDVYRN